MALADAVQARLSVVRLAELTNPDDPPGTVAGVNAARLAAAATDAEAEFTRIVGVAFSASDPAHIAAGLLGVLYYLHTYGGLDTDLLLREYDKWIEALERLRSTYQGRWIAPSTTSRLRPSRERTDVPILPSFDADRFAAYSPRPPFGADEDRTRATAFGGGLAAAGAAAPTEVGTVTLSLTLDAGAIAVQGVTLSPVPSSLVLLSVNGGVDQIEGVDFLVTGATLSWAGFPLAAILAPGDILVATYGA